ncbi:uncharacterized protein LOC135844912 isoform X8 [Planococcus citri]|uniref:uncharacterized protein LOC135844912 isoform X8 n=1 Tax=Planococcus citri TaxID=170843 RepID=UPI0031F9D859
MSSLEPLCNFRRNPCTLEHTASVVSAAVLCRQAAKMNPTNPPEKVREIIALPPAIEQKIERFMPMVKEQIAWWNNFYDRQIFFDRVGSRAQEYFHVLVWSTDGTINDEETAREMLKKDDLTAAEKYRIACNHCLKNEIRTSRSKLKTKVDLRKVRGRYPLVYYWECVCRKGKTTGLTKYIVDKVCNGEHNYPACATEYFLNRLNLDKRINFLKERYLQNMSFRSWENFLMKLTNKELETLFFDDVEDIRSYGLLEFYILKYLMRFWMHADFVVQVWMRIRDRYWPGAFVCLIEEFFTCDMFDIHSTGHISLAVEIFNLAPDKLQHVICDGYRVNEWWNRDLNLTDVRLDVAILSTTDPNYRRNDFWAMQWINVFKKYPTDCFRQFMDVCCEEEGTEEFNTQVMKMNDYSASEHCSTLLIKMRFSEIDQFLNVFSSDACRIMETKQRILRESFFWWANWYKKDIFVFPPPNQLVDFIEGSFENIRSANKFKMEVLSSLNCLKAFYKVAGNDLFSWLKESVWMCSSDDDFKLYKNKFSQLGVQLTKSSEISEISAVFKDPGWKSFFEWCSDKC